MGANIFSYGSFFGRIFPIVTIWDRWYSMFFSFVFNAFKAFDFYSLWSQPENVSL